MKAIPIYLLGVSPFPSIRAHIEYVCKNKNGINAVGNILQNFSITFDLSLNAYIIVHTGKATMNNPVNILNIELAGISFNMNIFAIYM